MLCVFVKLNRILVLEPFTVGIGHVAAGQRHRFQDEIGARNFGVLLYSALVNLESCETSPCLTEF